MEKELADIKTWLHIIALSVFAFCASSLAEPKIEAHCKANPTTTFCATRAAVHP